ncbi:MAG: helix-turn-helix transcriptional regulator [Desulfobacter sp.]|nr:MAG: helix-turn-helix transcriptional regulator [Desulfobacter sp.]
MEGLSNKIKEAREQKKLTLEQLAKEVGSSRGYIWQIEKDPQKKPSFDIIVGIAKALGLSLDYLANQNEYEMSDDQKNKIFIQNYNRLDDTSKKIIEELVKHLTEISRSPKK